MPSRIKGATLIANLAALREVLGAPRLHECIAACPPATQQLLSRTLVAVEWIPLDTWGAFRQVIFEQTFRRDENQYRRLVRSVCKREFATIYRAFLNNGTPSSLSTKARAIWAAYFDTGSLRIETSDAERGPTRCTIQIRDLETSYPLYAIEIQAYIEQLLTMVGADNVLVLRKGEAMNAGRLSCDFIVSVAPGSNPGLSSV